MTTAIILMIKKIIYKKNKNKNKKKVIDHEIFCIHGGIPRPVEEFETEVRLFNLLLLFVIV
jgi:hypothetical protein